MSPFQSIKGKLLLFTLSISIIPIVTITTIYFFNTKNTLTYQILEKLEAVAMSRNQHILSTMDKVQIQTVDFSSDGFIRNNFRNIVYEGTPKQHKVTRLNRYLEKYKLPLYHHLTAIMLVDRHGKIISSTHEKLIGKDFSDQDVFKQALSRGYGKPYVDQPRYLSCLGLNTLCISAPIISVHSSEVLGVIINAYNLAILNDITSNRIGLGETGEVYLVNKDKIMLTESRFKEGTSLRQVVDTEPVRKILESGEGMVEIYKDYRNMPVVGVSIYLSEYEWILLAKTDVAEIFAPLRTLGIIVLVLGLTSTVIVVSTGIIFAISTSKPIKSLTNATKRLGRGDLDYRVKVSGKDEIGELASSFNIMAEELAREIAEHKSAEEALRESEQKFRAIFDNATDGILLADTETKQFFIGNKMICQMLGYSYDEIKNLKIMDIHPESNLSSMIEKFEKQVRREITSAKDIPVRRKDGVVFYADISSACITLGGKAYLIGIFRDITDRKRIEDELKEFNKILEQRVAERTSTLKRLNEELQTEIAERKQVEEALRVSRASLANAQRIAHLGNWKWDIVKNKISGSDEFYRICGLTPQILQEFAETYESFINFVHPDDKEFVEKTVYEALHKKKPFNIDFRIILESGSERIVYVQAEVVFDDTEKIIQMNGTVQDITAFKRLEEGFRKISNAVEQSSSLIIITNDKGNIEYVNPKFTQITGYAPEEVIGENPRFLKSGKTPPEEYKRLWTTITSGGEWRGEFMNKKKNGELYCELASISLIRNSKGIITHFVAVKEDITERKQMEEKLKMLNKSLERRVIERTAGLKKVCNELQLEILERKQAEEALRMSESKYRLLLENLPQRIFYKDINLVYVSCNENLAKDLHIRSDGIRGKTDYDFYPKDLADKYRADDKRIIKSGQIEDVEEKYIKDGQELIIRMVRTPIKDEKGNIIGVLGIFWDITEKVTLQRDAIRNRHLIALGELAAGVGHEINNPMTGVINCAQILSHKSKEGSKEKDLANRIIREGDRVVNIVHSLLSFANSGEKKNIVSIQEILSNTLILTESQLRKDGIGLKVDISSSLPQIYTHQQQIQRVFLNVISNARYALNQKYPETHDNKILEISGEEITMNNHPYIKITFYDHGIGIPDNIINKVLDPFFTTKPRHKATGLGLSISYSIIKDHGGKILIESVEGEFTKVVIVLPILKP